MGLLALGGNFAGGFAKEANTQRELALKEDIGQQQILASQAQVRQSDSTVALNNIKLKEAQAEFEKKRAFDDTITEIPIDKETNPLMHQKLVSWGQVNNIPGFHYDEQTGKIYAPNKAKEVFSNQLASNNKLSSEFLDTAITDEQNNFIKYKKMVDTGQDEQGNTISGKNLEAVQQKMKMASDALTEYYNIKKGPDIAVARARALTGMGATTAWGVTKDGQPIDRDKMGRYFINGEYVAQLPAGSVPNSVMAAGVQRNIVSSGTTMNNTPATYQRIWNDMTKAERNKYGTIANFAIEFEKMKRE